MAPPTGRPSFGQGEESLGLAFEISGGITQDYAEIISLQAEDEVILNLLEIEKLAERLVQGSPQEHHVLSQTQEDTSNLVARLQASDAQHIDHFAEDRKLAQDLQILDVQQQEYFDAERNLAQNLQTFDAQQEEYFDADRALAQSFANEIPQDGERFRKLENDHQTRLQEAARMAREISEREDRAEMATFQNAISLIRDGWPLSVPTRQEEQNQLDHDALEERQQSGQLVQSNPDLQSSAASRRTGPPPNSSPLSMKDRYKIDFTPPAFSRPQSGDHVSKSIAERRKRNAKWHSEIQQNNKNAKRKSTVAVGRRSSEV